MADWPSSTKFKGSQTEGSGVVFYHSNVVAVGSPQQVSSWFISCLTFPKEIFQSSEPSMVPVERSGAISAKKEVDPPSHYATTAIAVAVD